MLLCDKALEVLRTRLNETVLNNIGSLTDKDIVELSQQIDELIVLQQRKIDLERKNKITVNSHKQCYDGQEVLV